MPRRVNDFRGLAEVSRVKLLGAVQKRPGSRLKELADEVGLHVNTARDHLRILIEEGFVCLEPAATGTRGRPPMVYRPVDDPEANEAARERIDRAREHRQVLRRLANGDGTQPAALDELGDDAGAQFDVLYEHLDDSGMEPMVDEEEMRISLAPCPHYRMVGDEREIACAIHANLVRSLLGQVPGPLELDRLLPFTSADTCQILLRDADYPGAAIPQEPEAGSGAASEQGSEPRQGPEAGSDPDDGSQ
nr:winged helix-turn-helix transcriptional regulator [Brevibacterium renqingii]